MNTLIAILISLISLISSLDQYPTLRCSATGESLKTKPLEVLRVQCLRGCIKELISSKRNSSLFIQGYKTYPSWTSICIAAIHSGVIKENLGGVFELFKSETKNFYEGKFSNSLLSYSYYYSDEQKPSFSFTIFSPQPSQPPPILVPSVGTEIPLPSTGRYIRVFLNGQTSDSFLKVIDISSCQSMEDMIDLLENYFSLPQYKGIQQSEDPFQEKKSRLFDHKGIQITDISLLKVFSDPITAKISNAKPNTQIFDYFYVPPYNWWAWPGYWIGYSVEIEIQVGIKSKLTTVSKD